MYALRHQLAVYQRSRRPELTRPDRRFWSTLARGWSEWRGAISLVEPDTVVRWHRTAWRRYWTWKSRPRRAGRPRVTPEGRELICRMADENRTWGAIRIVGELRALGIEVSASTVRVYRRRALRRPPSHWNVTAHPTAAVGLAADHRRDGDFVRRARAIGIETVLSPIHAPKRTHSGARDRHDPP